MRDASNRFNEVTEHQLTASREGESERQQRSDRPARSRKPQRHYKSRKAMQRMAR